MDESDELSPFIEWRPENMKYITHYPPILESVYETRTLEICVKLVLHITLISIFETLFYFLYISSLENNGIEWTISAFINKAVNGCEHLNATQIEKMNTVLKKYVNVSDIILAGNNDEVTRILYNKNISEKAWIYISGFTALFMLLTIYIKCRRIKIYWSYIILENTAMVGILALYELVFFNTIIYPYQPISTNEIERNMVENLQNSCGLLR